MKKLLLGVSVCIFLLSACGKEKDSFVPYALDGEITNLIDAILGETQSFVIEPNTEQIISIDKSSEFKVFPSTFVTDGQQDITVDWMNAQSAIEMELLDLPNYSNGKYLNPIYTFQLGATEGTNVLELNSKSSLQLSIESAFNEDVSMFYLSSEGWSAVDMADLDYHEYSDNNGNEKSGYIADIRKNGWYTLSKTVDIGSQTFSGFCIELSGEYTQKNTKSFVILENDIVVPMARVEERGTFCSTMNIPINQEIRVIVMSNIREGEYEFFYSQQMMENGLIVAPIMEDKTIDEIRSILQNI